MNNRKVHSKSPIFIHSLFRSGSTYIFNLFRNSTVPYWCYQEPLHEKALFAKENHEILLESDEATSKKLRHPKLSKPYFFELYEVSSECLGYIDYFSIYRSYFSSEEHDNTINYFNGLIKASKARTVIQECRTSSRIGHLKNNIGGDHIYLWRNSWDQWWSYKILDYFDTASQVIINSKLVPKVIDILRKEIKFSQCEISDINAEFFWFKERKLAFEDSYLVFYILWFLGLNEAKNNADLLINIDSLSNDSKYSNEIEAHLEVMGIEGITFDDCRSPQLSYSDSEKQKFISIEKRAHSLLLLSGFQQVDIDGVLSLSEKHQGYTIENDKYSIVEKKLHDDAVRARNLVKRYDDDIIDFMTRSRANEENRHNSYSTEVEVLKSEIISLNSVVKDLSNSKNILTEELNVEKEVSLELKLKYNSIVNSQSWRLTQPLRWINSYLKKK